jgi:phosphatidylinositol alpha-1,6-mannosyltransferase
VKLVLLSSELPPGPGGIGNHAYHLALELQRRGWQVTVVAPQDYAREEEIAAWSQRQPFEVVRLRRGRLAFWRGFRWLWRSFFLVLARRPDLLVASGQRTTWLAGMVARMTGRRLAAVGHGTEFGVRGRLAKALNRFGYNRAELLVAVSNYTRQVLLDSGLEPARLEVIPNGADATLYRPLPPEEIEELRGRDGVVAPEHRLLLTVGRVDRRKGQDLVIRALPQIVAELPDVHYVVIGLPDRAAELQQLARELGVDGHVVFLGRQPTSALVGYYNACDLFVLTSRHTGDGDFEGYGIAVVEAALCGKCALVAGDSGLAEAVVDGATGLVVPPEDPEAIASHVLRLLRDDALRRKLGKNALERARAEMSWRKRGGEYHDLFSSLI